MNYNESFIDPSTFSKRTYYIACKFKFDVFCQPNIPGYELLFEETFSTDIRKGIHRDHMVSVNYGYIHNINPELISHPANCCILLAKDNITKGNGCSITLDELIERIHHWDNKLPLAKIEDKLAIAKIPKTQEFKDNMKKVCKNLRTYTDGKTNVRQNVDLPIPEGFWAGATRRKNSKAHNANISKSSKGKYHMYTNGQENIKHDIDLPVPTGYYPGITKGIRKRPRKTKPI